MALRLTIDDLRRAARGPRLDRDAVESAQCVERTDAPDTDACAWAMQLLQDVGPADRATLRLLIAGVHSSRAIAAIRGCTLRAVQESRRRLRSLDR